MQSSNSVIVDLDRCPSCGEQKEHRCGCEDFVKDLEARRAHLLADAFESALREDWDAAAANFNRAHAIRTLNDAGLAALGICFFAKGDLSRALARWEQGKVECERLVESATNGSLALAVKAYNSAVAFAQTGNLPDAEKEAAAACEHVPEFAPARHLRSMLRVAGAKPKYRTRSWMTAGVGLLLVATAIVGYTIGLANRSVTTPGPTVNGQSARRSNLGPAPSSQIMTFQQRLAAFRSGRDAYLERRYASAETILARLPILPADYFADDALYYLALSTMEQGNADKARTYANRLLQGYPTSEFANSVIRQMARKPTD